jgi:hypothetical protein
MIEIRVEHLTEGIIGVVVSDGVEVRVEWEDTGLTTAESWDDLLILDGPSPDDLA